MGNLTKFKHNPPLFDLYTSQKVGSKKILMKQHDKNYKSHAFNEMGNCEKWGVKVGIGGEMTQKRRDRTQPKYKALDMTEHALKVAIRTIDRHAGEGYAKEHPELISAFMTTAAANFATLTEREIAEAEQVTTINVKTGEVEL